MLGGDLGDDRVIDESARSKWAPRLGLDTEARVDIAEFGLRQPRVELDLVDGRDHTGLIDDLAQVGVVEVGDANRSRAAFLAQADECAPRVEVDIAGRRRPVDEIEVNLVDAKQARALVEGAQGLVIAMVGVPHLRGHEDVVAVKLAATQRLTDAALIVVEVRRVDVSVADLERLHGRVDDDIVRHLPDAESDDGDGAAVVHLDERGEDHGDSLG